MASSSTLKVSSSTSNCDSYEYDVFLSFRGKDTRHNFTDHLYASLDAHGIHTFRDEEKLEKGGHIASNLFRAIEESKIFIIVFSKNYAESKWCLNELVRIIDRMTKKKSTVFPVFYHVEPTNVRNQRESFEDAVLYRAAKGLDQKTIKRWKNALKTAADLKGYHLKNINESEAEFIQKIREKIITTLSRKFLHVDENMVGMDFHLKELKSLIETESDEVQMVGIYGTGGIGKTTISMAIYNDILSEFYGSSFLKNVGGKGEDDVVELQKTLLQDILKCKRPKFRIINEGIEMIRQRLRSKRVLIVVDDVDNYTQLENLAGKNGWYGARSLIIITTRNLHLLDHHNVEKKYEVNILDPEKSTKLFCLWAFKQTTPKPNFESLSDSIVKCAGGLPIALRVFGSMLFGRTEEEWQSALDQLKEIPHEEVQRKLKVSYDKLDDTKQKMFLDIACFFRGEDKDFASRIFGRYAKIGIKVLHDSCLITISENRLDMHDLLQQMGREIVRQECVEEPGKRSRLWDPNDVDSVLTRNTGTEAIEGLFVDMFASNKIQFSTDSFTKLNRLRLLKVYSLRRWRDLLVDLPQDIEFPAFNLRYFRFDNYPLESLPTNFHAKNLVELNLRNSSIKQLWKKNEILNNLKVINLEYSRDLIEVPNLSSVPNLVILILAGCTSLESLPESISNMENLERLELSCTKIEELPYSIGHLKALKHLDLASCTELVSLPESIWNLSSLETLEIRNCPKLKRLWVKLGGSLGPTCLILKGGIWWSNNRFSSLKTLNLQHNKMEGEVRNHHVFPLSSLVELCIRNSTGMERGILSDSSHLSSLEVSSFGNFNPMARGILSDIFHQSSLQTLSLHNNNLMEAGIRSDIWNLSSLIKLSLTNCNLTEGEILNHVCHLSSLQRLSLEGNHFSSIPAGISRLSHLKYLNLSHCKKLQEIPELPSSLRFLDVHCSEGILSSPNLLSIPSLLNCFNSELTERINIEAENSLFVGKGMSIVIPRSSGIVEGIRNQSIGRDEVEIELPQHWYENNELLGFALCCVFEMLDDGKLCLCGKLAIKGDYQAVDMGEENYVGLGQHYNEHNDDSVSDQVWVIYYPKDVIKKECGSNAWTHITTSFDGSKTYKVKECGIHLIYGCFKCQQNEECQRKLCLKGKAINELPFIERSFELGSLCLRECKNFESLLPSTICKLKSLTTLSCSGCSQLKIFPEILETTLENLKKLHLDGTAIEELPSSIQHLRGLQCLNLAYCNNLVSLPRTICHLKSLVFLSCSGCSQLKIFPETPETTLKNLRQLHLDGTTIEELPSSIQHLRGLQCLNLAYCNNLVSLPETFCYLKSLVFLSCLGCSQLKSFPEILENMENLRELYLDGTAIEELPSSIEHLGGLQQLHLANCNNLVNLPENICNLKFLKFLNVNFCSKLQKFPENLVSLQCLDGLGAAGFDSNMSSWETLNVSIVQLSKLRILVLSHCQKLLQIPQLPQSLRILDAHGCPCLETLSSPSSLLGFSLFKCFKSAIEEFECGSYWSKGITIFIPGNNGIPEWISHQEKGSEITIELPMGWWQDDNFLGFALCFAFVPLHIESKEGPCSLTCELNVIVLVFESLGVLSTKMRSVDELSYRSSYQCCHNGGESNRVLVAYYPKVAIKKEDWSNEWRHLKASFRGTGVKVEECGLHLIYEPNSLNRDSNGTNHRPRLFRENTNFNVKRSLTDAEEYALHLIYEPNSLNRDSIGTNHFREYTNFNVKRSLDDAKDHLTEDPHPKRSRHLQFFDSTQFSSS